MKKRLLNIGLAVALFGAPVAFAANAGGYVGVSGGGAKVEDFPSASEFNAELAALGITATSSVDDTDTGWKLFAGYRFNRNFAVEGSYADLGEATVDSTVTAPSAGTVSATWDAKTWALAAVGILPLANNFELFGKVGGHYWDSELSVKATSGGAAAADSNDDNGIDMLYGVGASYNFTRNFALRAEWEVYKDIGGADITGESDVRFWSAGLQYNF